MIPLDLHPDNPFRGVAWRFHLAALLVHKAIPPRKRRRCDFWVNAGAVFLDEHAAPHLRRRYPVAAVAEAHRIWSDVSARLRHEIELRILSGQNYEDVAIPCGIAPGVVAAYERIFYNVADRLDRSDYIVFVSDPTMSLFFGEPTLDVVLKRLAYCHGPWAADLLAGYLDGCNPAGIDLVVDRQIRRLIGLTMVPVNEATAPGWHRLGLIAAMTRDQVAADTGSSISPAVTVSGELLDDMLERLAIMAKAPATSVTDQDSGPILLDWQLLLSDRITGSSGNCSSRVEAV